MAFNERECGFCKSEVRPDASVCAHCGAHKGIIMETWGCLFQFGVFFLVLFPVLGWERMTKSTEDFFFVVAPIFLILLLFKLGSKSVWLRRN